MAETRNSYLVSRALKTFMLASVLASLAQRLATMTDAIVVSNLIGPDGISAINVVTPIITLFPTISILFGIGGSILAAKALGRRDAEEANRVFTLAILASLVSSIILTVILFTLTPEIVALVCPRSSRFYHLAVSFMHIMALSAVPTVMCFTLQSFVKTDGNPRLVMITVMSSTALNLVLDFVFIKYLHMGIAGSAWGTIICFIFSMSVCLIHLRSSHSSFHLDSSIFNRNRHRPTQSEPLQPPTPQHPQTPATQQPATPIPTPLTPAPQQPATQTPPHPTTLTLIKEGFPMSINTLLMGLCIFAFNSIVMSTLGADGMYVWAVCLQLLMLVQLMLGGVGSTIYSIGGMLVGEQDMIGLNILIRRVLTYITLALISLTVIVELWPQAFGNLFGGSGSGISQTLHTALRIFSLILLPYAILSILGALYQLLGYRTASLLISIAQLAVMVLCVWLATHISPALLWWGFPASAILLIVIALATTITIHFKHTNLAPVTLIPQAEEAQALNFSVRLTEADVESALTHIDTFLQQCNISHHTSYNVRLCSEELLYNIVHYAVKRHPEHHFIDIHIRCTNTLLTLLIKDDGRPFNPILKETPTGIEHLGLRLINSACKSLTYKYMYDQNMVYMTFPPK